MVKAIAVDMDGTFLDSKKTYDKLRFEAIFTELRNRDITFIAASGNQYAKLKSIFGDRDMYFISENGAVIYNGNELYNYKSFNRQVFQQVVDYLNMKQSIDQLVICGLKSAYILKHTSEAFKEDTRFYYHQLKEIDSLQQLPEDDYVKIAFNINRETHPNVDEEVATQFSNDIKLVSSGNDSIDIIMPNMTKGQAGTNSITRPSFRVPNDDALTYYEQRFDEFGVKHEGIQELFGKKVLPFEEVDGQVYQLISDELNEGVAPGVPWKNGPVPVDKAIYGLGPIEIKVSYFDDFKNILETVYGMTTIAHEDNVALLEVGEGGNGGQVILIKDDKGPAARQGYGEVHHVSFRVKDHDAIEAWATKYKEVGINNSGIVNRFYFEALYARVGHILIEISTDGPGFMEDEPYETLGEGLSLPPFLENKREYIESEVRPFNTKRQHG
ncbi:TPA: HAD hydrolase family protein [Staphylococcus aureus]|nr:HAD hydrolase family protein [Staphylococcus aureus]